MCMKQRREREWVSLLSPGQTVAAGRDGHGVLGRASGAGAAPEAPPSPTHAPSHPQVGSTSADLQPDEKDPEVGRASPVPPPPPGASYPHALTTDLRAAWGCRACMRTPARAHIMDATYAHACVHMHKTHTHTRTHARTPHQVELVLTENDYTLKMWPYKFKAVRRAGGHGGGEGEALSHSRSLVCVCGAGG